MKKWIVISSVVVLLGGLFFFFTFRLAPGSYYTFLSSKKSTIPQKTYELCKEFNYPEGSIYKPTDDFELITEDLPKPIIKRDYDPDFEFEKWENTGYEESGRLQRVWGFDAAKEGFELNDVYKSSSIPGNIWMFPTTDRDKKSFRIKDIFFDPISGTYMDNYKPPYFIDNYWYHPRSGFCDRNAELHLDNLNNMVSLKDKNGRIFWLHRFKKVSGVNDYSPHIVEIIEEKAIVHWHDKFYCIDISSGDINWILKNKIKDVYNGSKKASGYLWIYMSNAFYEGVSVKPIPASKQYRIVCYRISLSNLEVIKIGIDPIYYSDKFDFFGDSLYFRENDSIMEHDIKTGLNIRIIDDKDYDIGSLSKVFSNGSPYIQYRSELSKEGDYLREKYIYTDDEFQERWVIAKRIRSIESEDENVTADAKLFGKIRFSSYSGVGFDDDTVFGIDTTTGQKTWWIDRSELSDDALIQIVDRNGVCISEGSVISCYRKP